MAVNTLTVLRARMPTRLGLQAADLAIADIDWAINSGKRRVQRQIDTYWQQTAGTFSTSAGVVSYSLPSDYHSFITAWIIDGDRRVSMNPIDRIEEIASFPPGVSGETQGRPTDIGRYGKSLFLRPTPDKVYTVHFDYLAYLPDLVSGGDNDDITNNYEEMLYAGAGYEMAQDRTWFVESERWEKIYEKRLMEGFADQIEEDTHNTIIISRGTGYRGRQIRRTTW